jgi:hypothetical protein
MPSRVDRKIVDLQVESIIAPSTGLHLKIFILGLLFLEVSKWTTWYNDVIQFFHTSAANEPFGSWRFRVCGTVKVDRRTFSIWVQPVEADTEIFDGGVKYFGLGPTKFFVGLPWKNPSFSLSPKKLLKTRGNSGYLKSDDFFSHVLVSLSPSCSRCVDLQLLENWWEEGPNGVGAWPDCPLGSAPEWAGYI